VASNPFFSDTGAETGVNALAALCNGGTLNIYAGSQPTDANTAVSGQTLLATLTFSSPAFAAATASGSPGSKVVTATANAIGSATSVGSGTASWFRVLTSGSAAVLDGSAGTSGCDLNLSSTAITGGGQTVSVSSFSISQNE
jgi:hypothetical protein